MASLFSAAPFWFRNLAATCRAVWGDTGSATIVIAQQKTAAKVAIKRAQNELARFVEREQARPQVNVIRIFFMFFVCLKFVS